MMHWATFKYFLEQVTKRNHSKNHLHVKVFLGEKDMQSFSKVVIFILSYRF
jgi:hypothetical protein